MRIMTVTPTDVVYEVHSADATSLTTLQAECGGPVEAISLTADRVMWVHEDGKSLGQPFNRRATAALKAAGRAFPGDWIAGTAVITGRKGPETTSLTDEQLARTYQDLAIR
ncbi:DUF3846 domain-containing protein [Streptomyces sp. OF3]|uniref:DUF3846 domain-containing protein n=1 Tax=Streptomyces alkaliterrae TaxID=2213162 RepID=A0A7W3WRF3_9ACTN|nr:DUF3846 domain-containing protein [Streptomyces alkaliterrae]MBB1257122.1 DUF3846 domain-containing protein [Streptomyces alkaliterrae]